VTEDEALYLASGDDIAAAHAVDQSAKFAEAVGEEMYRLRIKAAAARAVRVEQLGDTAPRPELILLSDFLAAEDEPVQYRVDRLWPVGGRIVLAAQYKSGKTTMVGNLLRSLADGEPFLDEFEVTSPDGRVVLFDNELDPRMMRRWLREQEVSAPEAVVVQSLRGRLSSFDITDPETRTVWAKALREVDAATVVLDCLRPILDALGMDENTEAGRFLVAFDELLREAGVQEGMIIHHMGHNGERSRGSSRIRDWPDVEWRLVRERSEQDGEPASPESARYFSAYGRDVDVREGLLTYDWHTRHLAFAGGNRREAMASRVLADLIELLIAHPGLSKNKVENSEELKAKGHARAPIRTAIDKGIADGVIIAEKGGPRATFLRVNLASSPVRRSSPEVRQRTSDEFASSPIGRTANSVIELGGEFAAANWPQCLGCGEPVDPAAGPTHPGCQPQPSTTGAGA
jgi:hypothetical protein